MENLKIKALMYLFVITLFLAFSGILIVEWLPFINSAYGEESNHDLMWYSDLPEKPAIGVCTQAFFGHRYITRCENDEVICYTGHPNMKAEALECKWKVKEDK